MKSRYGVGEDGVPKFAVVPKYLDKGTFNHSIPLNMKFIASLKDWTADKSMDEVHEKLQQKKAHTVQDEWVYPEWLLRSMVLGKHSQAAISVFSSADWELMGRAPLRLN